jgi:hypothetical protein
MTDNHADVCDRDAPSIVTVIESDFEFGSQAGDEMVTAVGCGPVDWLLMASAAFGEANENSLLHKPTKVSTE